MERHSESITNLAVALALTQAAMKTAAKDTENTFHGNRYASLASAWEAAREPMTGNGLALVQLPSADGPRVTVTTMLMHKSGEWMACDLQMTAASATAQAIGSAITYARRYSMMAMLGVAPDDDDDGEGAEGRAKGQTKESMKAKQQEIAAEKIRKLEAAKAAEQQLGVTEIDLEHRLKASVDQAQRKRGIGDGPGQREAKSKFAEMMEAFQGLKKKCEGLGQLALYYGPLGGHGHEHANEIRDMEEARKIYKEIVAGYTDALGRVDEAEAIKELV